MKATAKVLTLALVIGLFGGLVQAVAAKTAAALSQAYTWKNVVTGGGGGYVPRIIFNESQMGTNRNRVLGTPRPGPSSSEEA